MQFKAASNFILNKLEKELSPILYYHGMHHTLEVFEMVQEIAFSEGNISDDDMELLKLAALFHDSGFTEGFDVHEQRGVEICRKHLPDFGFDEEAIAKISGMILATKIPQEPQNKLERIICDADLDYLGRDDFYSIGKTLFDELQERQIISSEEQWNKIQVSFLEGHEYHTKTNLKRRKEQKDIYLEDLRKIVAAY